jgi:hypothetical protein
MLVSASSLLLSSVLLGITWFAYRAFFTVRSGDAGAKLPTWATLEIALVGMMVKSNGLPLRIL